MSKHPVSLLSETQGLNGYQFKEWLEKRSDAELQKLTSLSYSLEKNIKEENDRRNKLKQR